jgi:hypothetical protein
MPQFSGVLVEVEQVNWYLGTLSASEKTTMPSHANVTDDIDHSSTLTIKKEFTVGLRSIFFAD